MLDSVRFMLCCAAAAAATAAVPAWGAFKCVDERGKRYYQDTPPVECAGVTIYEVNASGSVVRKIEPNQAAPAASPPSKTSERATQDRARHDRALLDSYASEAEIDATRDRKMKDLNANVANAQQRLHSIKAQREQLARSPLRPTLGKPGEAAAAQKAEDDRLANEEATVQKSLAHHVGERDRVANQFEADKQRWKELKGAR